MPEAEGQPQDDPDENEQYHRAEHDRDHAAGPAYPRLRAIAVLRLAGLLLLVVGPIGLARVLRLAELLLVVGPTGSARVLRLIRRIAHRRGLSTVSRVGAGTHASRAIVSAPSAQFARWRSRVARSTSSMANFVSGSLS